MENDTSIVDREEVQSEKLTIENDKPVGVGHSEGQLAHKVSEHGTSSVQKDAPGEDSCAITLQSGPYMREFEGKFTISSAVESLNILLDIFSLANPVIANSRMSPVRMQAFIVSRSVIYSAFELSSQTGQSVVMFLEQVMVYMELSSLAVSTDLKCLLLFRCAKIFMKHERPEYAVRACLSARVIAACEPHLKPLKLVISMLLIKINGRLEEQEHQQLRTEIRHFLAQSGWHSYEVDTTGLILEMPYEFLEDLEMTEMVIHALTEALRMEGETTNEATKQGCILLMLASYYHCTKRRSSRQACLLLLEQALAGLQQAECSCHERDIDALLRLNQCGCHDLLADAFLLQGHMHVEQGNRAEAEKSYHRSLSLTQEYNDKQREAICHLMLARLQQSRTFMNEGYGLRRGIEIRDEKVSKLEEDFQLHWWKYVKCMGETSAPSVLKDIAAITAPFLGKPRQSDDTRHYIANVKSFLELQAQRGDFAKHADAHAELSVNYARLFDAKGTKEQFFLALGYLKRVDVPMPNAMVSSIRQKLAQVALLPEIMELDHAYDLWLEEYLFAQEMLEDLAHLSEDHALQYFETTKHATTALAKCQITRAWILRRSGQTSQCVAAMKLSFEALMWAERGKGRMLMSFIAANEKESASKVKVATLQDRLNLPSDDFECRFLTEDSFAIKFLQGRSPELFRLSLKPKAIRTMFIEYTFIDSYHLLTQVTDSFRIIVMSNISNLSRTIDKEIQLEAESELESLQNRNSSNFEELGPGARAADKVLSAMNKYGTNRIPFNKWIPGMVAGIQRRAAEAQLLRKKNKSFHKEEQKIRQLLQALYAILIQPISLCLSPALLTPDIFTLVFVPHEDLGVVPFAALHAQDGSRYLIEDFAISVSPAIWCSRHCEYVYEEKIRSDPAENIPVLVGRKSGYPPPFSDLSQAHDEVAAAAQALGQTAYTIVLDDTPEMNLCMKERVMELLPRASWVHLSVHGEVSPQFPQGSMLLGTHDDQRLTATEIITNATSSSWKARCVIASACQTGLGSVAGGGIMGFARSFIMAGVPSCVLSMWEVNEAFCTRFMGKLYGGLRSGETLGDAIKSTVESMIKEKKPPTREKKKSSRFKSKTPEPADAEPMWSILDWAAFSCFGYPRVKLVADGVALTRYKEMLALAPSVDRKRFTSEDAFLASCLQPTLFANGTKGFCLNLQPCGVCLRMAARGMNITWGNDERYWGWISSPNSWFPQVALLKAVCWFEARGEIDVTLAPGSYSFSWRIFLSNQNVPLSKYLQDGWVNDPAHFILSKNDEIAIERKCFMSINPQVSRQPVNHLSLPTIHLIKDGWREYEVCRECFFSIFENEIHATIVENQLFKPGDRVAVAASGGKDNEEFYEQQRSLSLEDLVHLVIILKEALWQILWIMSAKAPSSVPMQRPSHGKPPIFSLLAIKDRVADVAANLLAALHDRNSRRQFTSPQDFHARDAVDEKLFSEAEGENTRAQYVLRKAPFLVPFTDRVQIYTTLMCHRRKMVMWYSLI